MIGNGTGSVVGVQGAISDARGIESLRGPFLNSSVTAGDGWAGSGDVFVDPVNRDTAGVGVTIGGGEAILL